MGVAAEKQLKHALDTAQCEAARVPVLEAERGEAEALLAAKAIELGEAKRLLGELREQLEQAEERARAVKAAHESEAARALAEREVLVHIQSV